MKVVAEIDIRFDMEEPRNIGRKEIADSIASAVSECSKIENVASVKVEELHVCRMCVCGGYDAIELDNEGHAQDCPEAQE